MQKRRDFSYHILFQGVILIGFFLLIFKLIVTGNIHYFIAPKMVPFAYFSVTVLFILGVIQIWRGTSGKIEDVYCGCGFIHDQGGSFLRSLVVYTLFICPVLTGLVFPNTALDSSVAANRGIKYGSGLYTKPPEVKENTDTSLAEEYLKDPEAYMENLDKKIEEQGADQEIGSNDHVEMENNNVVYMTTEEMDQLAAELENSDKITLDEKRYLAIMDLLHTDPQLFIGKEVELIGFVYKEPEFEEDQFVVARFAVSCCVADASVYGLIASITEAPSLDVDQWVKATGTLDTTKLDGWELPFLKITQLEKIEQPANPYVYEVYTQLTE
ncbi:permease [Bacillus sp. J14TS2]|uniref:TIGR03943 family putative permease subunit n=1 Tax=Bacillus sp. J14TS2 TaxID=2807188 RepID=UPI001B0A139D|nr:TIGR03943 family protein [Bacillus sp. J14TS2]GIN69716.1 permease [Bacillus sp. J14TS2]